MKKTFITIISVVLLSLLVLSCNPDQGIFDQMIDSKPKLGIEIKQLVAKKTIGGMDTFIFVSKDGKLYKSNTSNTSVIYDSSSEYVFIEQAYISGTTLTFRLLGNSEYGTTSYTNAIREVVFDAAFENSTSTDLNKKANILTSNGKKYTTNSSYYGLYESEGDILVVPVKNKAASYWMLSVDGEEAKSIENASNSEPLAFVKDTSNSNWYVLAADKYLYKITGSESYSCEKVCTVQGVYYNCASFIFGNDIFFHTGSTFGRYNMTTKKSGTSNSLSGAANYDINYSGCILKDTDTTFYVATQSNGIYKIESADGGQTFTGKQIALASLAE